MYKQIGKDGGINLRLGMDTSSIALPFGFFWGKQKFSYFTCESEGKSHWWFGINILCFCIEYNDERKAPCLRDEE